MHRFYFHLRTRGTIVPDTEGMRLPDLEAARRHAAAVARDLMLGTDAASGLCSLRVECECGQTAFDLFFTDVDARLLAQREQTRRLAATTCRRLSAYTDVCCAARATLIESRMLLARARRRPQLVYAADR